MQLTKLRIDQAIITDDAGLCVDVLNGEPGVYTGRYAGEHATQEENLDKLLFNLKEDSIITARINKIYPHCRKFINYKRSGKQC